MRLSLEAKRASPDAPDVRVLKVEPPVPALPTRHEVVRAVIVPARVDLLGGPEAVAGLAALV